ncbi:hypothetical protein [Micromonospora parathelypteridis]|uniref:Uncharacterized protein n=1 Tax=Micromonospora parathelypteridis TaxID=1839617 RepID=A0A840VGU2_9ACTN|nr:hypothetical protein [Micromonospora parathelypteridis]MBB5476052.1 hypothetical protein [Micromonospora parathelypteridis]GGO32564.1 hypothetical protein GCM10011576_63120 [Micromonospora parathelypteridis]
MGHQLFDELIGTPPPPQVDVEDIVRRERRASSVRLIGGPLAALLALVVGVGVAVRDQGPGPAPGPPLAAPTPTAADTGFRLVFDTDESAEASASRLSAEFEAALREVVPGSTWFWIPDHVGEARKPDGRPPVFTHHGRDDMVSGGSGVSYRGRRGPLGVSISPDVFESKPTDRPGDPFKRDEPAGHHWPCELPAGYPGDQRYDRVCVEGTTPGGLRMKTETLTGKRGGSVQHIVTIQLPGNRVFNASVSNMVGVDEQAVAAQPEPPLSAEQLSALAVRVAERIRA